MDLMLMSKRGCECGKPSLRPRSLLIGWVSLPVTMIVFFRHCRRS